MGTTPNYGLYVEDNPATKFKTWREGINKSVGSNMTKIDQALSEKADHSTSVTTTLSASGWSGVDAPFTYELAVEGLGAAQNGSIDVAQTATFEERKAAREAQLCLTGQADGKLFIAADGELPEIDIPVVVVLLH